MINKCLLVRGLVTLSLIATVFPGLSQDPGKASHYPEVGRLCPNFKLHNIKYFAKTEASLKDFKGKWLILDFFTKDCGGCIASFPRVNEQAKSFSDKLVYMLVAAPGKETESLYAKFREKEHLVMPCTFDHSLFEKWGISSVPRIFVIDDKGILRAYTLDLSTKELKAFIEGQVPASSGASQTPINPPSSPMLYGSKISYFDPATEKYLMPIFTKGQNGQLKLEARGMPLFNLINFAFWGVMTPGGQYGSDRDSTYLLYADNPIIATKDSAVFHYSARENENIFNYSLQLPADQYSEGDMKKMMREDLCRYFGWNISVVTRPQPCWTLTANDSARKALSAKGGPETFHGEVKAMRFSMKNTPFNRLFNMIYSQMPRESILMDRTGITGNIDLSLDGDGPWTGVEDIRSGLKKMGLDIVPAQKEMKTLLIQDRSLKNDGISASRQEGVHFEDGLTWQQVMARAKTENKRIFVYCADRSEACSNFETTIFPIEIVGDYMNSRFISVRYQMDSVGYPDAQMFKERYLMKDFPFFLFFSPEGKPIHMTTYGGTEPLAFITFTSHAANPEIQYFTLLDRYTIHRINKAEQHDLFQYALGNHQTIADEIGHDYIRRFMLSPSGNTGWETGDVDVLLFFIGEGDTLASGIFDRYRVRINAAMNTPYFVEKTLMGRILNDYLDRARQNNQNSPDWDSARQEIVRSCPAFDFDETFLQTQMHWYESEKNWPEYARFGVLYAEKFGSKWGADQWNDLAWKIFLHIKDASILEKAITWTRRALKISNNSPYILDTYAELLYKTKSKENYLEMESRVTEIIKDKATLNNYEKMKQGLPTWEE